MCNQDSAGREELLYGIAGGDGGDGGMEALKLVLSRLLKGRRGRHLPVLCGSPKDKITYVRVRRASKKKRQRQ